MMIGKTMGILAVAGLGLSLAVPPVLAQAGWGKDGRHGHWSTRTFSETDRGSRDRGQDAGRESTVETSPSRSESPSPRSRFSRQGGAGDRPGAEVSRGIFRDSDPKDWERDRNRASAREQFEEGDVSDEGGGEIDRSDYRGSRDRHRPGSNWAR